MKKSLGGDSDGWVGNKPCARPNFTGRKEVRALVWRTCVCACVCACVRARACVRVRVCKCVCKDQGVFVQGGSVLCSHCVLIRPWRREKVTRAICGRVMFCRLKAKLWFCVEVSTLWGSMSALGLKYSQTPLLQPVRAHFPCTLQRNACPMSGTCYIGTKNNL